MLTKLILNELILDESELNVNDLIVESRTQPIFEWTWFIVSPKR